MRKFCKKNTKMCEKSGRQTQNIAKNIKFLIQQEIFRKNAEFQKKKTTNFVKNECFRKKFKKNVLQKDTKL